MDNTTQSDAPSLQSNRWITLLVPLILFSLLATLYYRGLGDYGLFDPWETHYGEVARDMVERGNYIDPFWGSPWDSGGVKRERSGFYSKPPLTMWMTATGMKLFGFNAFGVRSLLPLLALCALLSVYLTMTRVLGVTAGILTTLCTATIPSFAFLSHQAVTDGPMVCILIVGMMSLIMAFSTPEHKEIGKGLHLFGLFCFAFIVVGQLWVIWPMDRSPDAIRTSPYQGHLISLQWYLVEILTTARGKGWVLATLIAPFAMYIFDLLRRLTNAREWYFTFFFICCGLIVPAKGWLGWAPMGGALVFYLLLTGEWGWITVSRVKRGLAVVILTGHIWVIAMLGGHHPAWVNRFIYHDHINRLFSGVHSTDDGAFEYFFQWIGYGSFPLIALAPLAIWFGIRRPLTSGQDQQKAAFLEAPKEISSTRPLILLTTLWALVGLVLFSKSNTKFHHYIFPVLPAFTILIGLLLARFWQGKERLSLIALLTAVGVLLWIGGDLTRGSRSPGQGAQHWINLFTYKYDRAWPIDPKAGEMSSLEREAASKAWRTRLSIPLSDQELDQFSEKLSQARRDQSWNTHLLQPVRLILLLALLSIVLLSVETLLIRRMGVILLCVSSVGMCTFSLHRYLPTVAPHWSQWELWKSYYERCDPLPKDDPASKDKISAQLLTFSSRVPSDLSALPAWCQAPAIAFRMNWRGEAFYTHNTVVPALYTKDLKPILQNWGVWDSWQPGKRFFIFTERSRIKTELERSLPKHLKGQYREVFGEGRRFVLLEVNPDDATQ